MTDPVNPPDDSFVPDPAGDPHSDDPVSSEHPAAAAEPSADPAAPESAAIDSASTNPASIDPASIDSAFIDSAAPDSASTDGVLSGAVPAVAPSKEVELYNPADLVTSVFSVDGRETRKGNPVVRFSWASGATSDSAAWVSSEALKVELMIYPPRPRAVDDGYDPVARAVLRDAMLEEVIALEREEARLHARKVRLYNRYREHTEESVQLAQNHADSVGGMPQAPGAKKAGWNAAVIAWREMTSELATATRKSENTIAQLVHEAEILCTSLPATMVALEAGKTSYRHVSVIASQARDVPEEMRGEFEEDVVPGAATLTVPKLKHRARQVRERMHPESINTRTKKAARGRYMDVDPAEDGMAFLSVKMTAVDATAINNRFADTAKILQTKEEKRSFGQLKVDAFRDVAINGTIPTDSPNRTTTTGTDTVADTDMVADGDTATEGVGEVMAGLAATGIVATVLVMVPALTLLERSDEPAILEGYGPIDLATAMVLSAGAPSWTRVLTHPETGVIMSVGNTRYRVPAAMRMWLRLQDLVCRFPGCNRPARDCDLDHIVEWQYGGHTSTDNLQNLCPGHHNVKSYTGWTVKYLENGRIEWVSPAGRTHITEPEIPLHFTTTPANPIDGENDDGDEPEEGTDDRRGWGNEDAWNHIDKHSDDDGWYIPPTDEPTPF
jgi:hypothetical protein